MHVYFVRHGLTAWNQAGRYQGHSDVDLLPLGHEQARRTAETLACDQARLQVPFSALYTSPLRRARQTALPIGTRLHLAPVVLPLLREMHGGQIESLTEREWQQRYPELVPGWRDVQNLDHGWPGGETRRAFRRRCWAALTAITARHTADECVIVVTHGGLIQMCLQLTSGGGAAQRAASAVANGSITYLHIGPADSLAREPALSTATPNVRP